MYVNSNFVDRSTFDKWQTQVESRAQSEVSSKLAEVNRYLEETNRQREKLDTMRDENDERMRKELDRARQDNNVSSIVASPPNVIKFIFVIPSNRRLNGSSLKISDFVAKF